jgi:hypothetical protein
MSTREEAMLNHPAGKVAGAMAVVEREEKVKSPFAAFFESLEELEMAIDMYGTASVEADMARANVRLHREGAASAWRQQAVSAA